MQAACAGLGMEFDVHDLYRMQFADKTTLGQVCLAQRLLRAS